MFEEFLQEEDPQEDEPQEALAEEKSYFGFSRNELIVMIVLAVIIVGLVLIVGFSFLRGLKAARDADSQLPPTITPRPSATPVMTATPLPEAGAIPGWNKFEFAESKASLWLPDTFQGGDPVAYAEIVMMTVETYSQDAAFVESVKNLLDENPDIRFFGFDVDAVTSARSAFAAPEQVHLGPALTLADYLDEYKTTALAEGDRLVGEEVVAMDHFEAGRLLIEFKVPLDEQDQYRFMKKVVYLVQVDDTIWNISYLTDRDDFPAYWPLIQESINTFRFYP